MPRNLIIFLETIFSQSRRFNVAQRTHRSQGSETQLRGTNGVRKRSVARGRDNTKHSRISLRREASIEKREESFEAQTEGLLDSYAPFVMEEDWHNEAVATEEN
ncbi:hypothetical protein O181_013318 [Austropuccinia psidii MF-1]|uniref:Uncharacterized protein n=1 Tax=Austropuccinia psidii MF-1 TaxID=1389203 RepID=A0A9Q3GN01_9BASI|nr:hypothetical protein [Austropuccinia psidii MF-1]